MAFLAHPCASRHLVHPALKIPASFRGGRDVSSEAVVILSLPEAGYICRLKLDNSPLEILLFKFRRSAAGLLRGTSGFPLGSGVGEAPRR